MKIRTITKTILPLAAAMGTLALTANAATIIGQPIGIDFSGSSTQAGDPVNPDGLTLSTQTNPWNTIAATSTAVSVTTTEGPTFNLNLTNAGGNDSHISGMLGSGSLRGSDFYGKGDIDGGLDTSGNTDWELTGLVANGVYNLIFFAGRDGRGYDWDVVVGSGFTKTRDTDTDTNFVGVVANGSGVISGSTTYFIKAGGTYHGAAGLQFEQTGVVPEPSTTALLGLGGLALILRRRK